MDRIFPFNLPAPTAWYAVLNVVTLLMHVLFMSYVLAGSIMLAVAGVRGMLGQGSARAAGGTGKWGGWGAVTTILKDWMPFALSAAITAGIAPLLFVQILYQQEFYTANLLSFHRWMAILPVLIVAFYLLYLLKAHRIEGKTAVQGVTAVVVMGCVLFVAWSWVENHLLSMNREVWTAQYESKAMFYKSPAILPRLGFWIASAFPTAGVLLAMQLRVGASRVSVESGRRGAARPSWVAQVGLAAGTDEEGQGVGGGGPFREARDAAGEAMDVSIWGGLAAAGIGAAAQVVCWARVLMRREIGGRDVLTGFVGVVLFWLGVLVSREAARLSVVGTEALFARHERVGTIAGLVVFLAFSVIGVGVSVWVTRTIGRARRGSGEGPAEAKSAG